jgi:hypothetical protein
VAAIADAIRALCKGRGIYAADLDQRLGPHLDRLVEVPRGRGTPVRQALVAELDHLVVRLPETDQLAIRAALGLAEGTAGRDTLTRRVEWLMEQPPGLSSRTAQRRIKDAAELLAEQVHAELERRRFGTPGVVDGWRLIHLSTVLRVHEEFSEAAETRLIEATRNDLTEVRAWHDLPAGGDGTVVTPDASIVYGGQLRTIDRAEHEPIRFVVGLPQALRIGDRHTFELRLRVAAPERLRPYYIFTPECPCERFTLRVRFEGTRRPRWIRRVDAEPVRRFDPPHPGTAPLALDAVGEVTESFREPAPYVGYGIQWAF